VQYQLVSLDRVAQIVFQFQADRDLLVHHAVEQRISGLAGRLRVIHGGVGIAQHLVGVFVIQRAGGDADAHGARDRMTHEFVGLAQYFEQSRGDSSRVGRFFQVLGQNHEFIAAEPRGGGSLASAHRVGRAHRMGKPYRNFFEQFVADFVAQAVIDELEPVEIQKEQRKMRLGTAHPPIDRLVDPIL